jgi:hypothetical protein
MLAMAVCSDGNRRPKLVRLDADGYAWLDRPPSLVPGIGPGRLLPGTKIWYEDPTLLGVRTELAGTVQDDGTGAPRPFVPDPS